MFDVDEVLIWLEALSVRFRPKTAESCEKAFRLTEIFEHLSPSDRELLVTKVSDKLAKKLLPLSAFLAERALVNGEERWIKASILLNIIEDFRCDYRENIRHLALIAYAATFVKVNFQDILKEVLPLASDRARQYLIDFDKRPTEINRLEKFGIKVVFENSEPRFAQILDT